MTIYRFSNWRPFAIFELFYHHTRPPTKGVKVGGLMLGLMSGVNVEGLKSGAKVGGIKTLG